MHDDTPVSLIERWFESFDPAMLAPDVQWVVPDYPVDHRIYVGPDAVYNVFFPQLRSIFAEWKAHPKDMTAHGNAVVVTGHYSAKRRKDGTAVTIPFVHVWTVSGSKIVKVLAHVEAGEMRAAAGLVCSVQGVRQKQPLV